MIIAMKNYPETEIQVKCDFLLEFGPLRWLLAVSQSFPSGG
jgi:hypothetical protein